ncbi:uncharacterized protein [Henckelia pumila]|uniref:uncharacterized protein n=1 Tax=Henckelia pumila TaxID=405737 RepID=UPI003C6E43D1
MVQAATLGLSDRPHKHISIVGSCNGLLCLSISVTDLVLWNPATGQFRTLPNSGTNYMNLDNWDDDCIEVEWRYLLANGTNHQRDKQNVVNVVFHQFSADTTYMVVPLPSALQNFYHSKYVLTVISGMLSICLLSGISSHLEIWLLKKKDWTKEAHIPFFPHGQADFCCPLVPMFLSPGKVLIHYGSTISVCDSSQPDSHQLGYTLDVVAPATTYTESLISPYIN